MAERAKASPTCLAAQTNITLYFSDNPRGVNVLPVPVGAIYSTNLGVGVLSDVHTGINRYISIYYYFFL